MKTLLEYRFNDLLLKKQALTHRSYLNESRKWIDTDYQRLEFLGDAVLGLVLAENLYRRFPDLPEGDLSRLRSVLVDQPSLAALAIKEGLPAAVKLGKGAEQEGGRDNPSILSDLFEAMIGAIYLDGGYDQVRTLIEQIYEAELGEISGVTSKEIDAKSRLQELLASRKEPPPSYHLAEELGPEHHRNFQMEVYQAGKLLGTGQGRSKKAAQQAAAADALKRLEQTVPGNCE